MGNTVMASAMLAASALFAQEAWAQSQSFDITSFNVEGATVLPAATVQAVVAPFKGGGKSLDDAKRAANALHDAYVAAGYPIVHVYVPDQKVSGGTVTLHVTEGKVATVTVAGAKQYKDGNIRASLPPLKENGIPNTADIVAAVLLANDNPAKQVAVNFAPGSTAGAVDARIDVVEDAIAKWTLTLDNAGSRSTGLERVGLGYQNANMMDGDHLLNVQFTTSIRHPADAASITAAYRIPFYASRLSLDLIGAYSDSKGTGDSAAGPLFFSGKGSYLGTRLNKTLPASGEFRHKASLGLDYKDFKNDCSLGGIALATCGTVTSMPLSVSYTAQEMRPSLQLGGSIAYYHNIPGGPHGDQSDYGTRPRSWDAVRGSAFIVKPLGETQLRLNLNAQWSNDVLIPSEQFGAGGASSVRGYDERAAAGDKGFTLNLEVQSPEVMPQWRMLGFFDYAKVYSNDATAGGGTRVSSIGAGLRGAIGKQTTIRFDLGYSFDPAGTRGDNRFFGHFFLAYVF